MSGRIIAFNDRGRPIGEGHHNAKLEDSDIDLIFALREEGLSLREIGEKFDVQKAAIWKVVHGYTRADTPSEWRPAGTRRTSPPRNGAAQAMPPLSEDCPGALLQRVITQTWR